MLLFLHNKSTVIGMLSSNFTCKTIAMIQLALGEKIVEVVK